MHIPRTLISNKMQSINNKYLRQALFVALLTVAVGMLFTMADFYDMPFRNTRDLLVIAAQFGVVETATFLFLWTISCNRYVFAAVFPVFTLACARQWMSSRGSSLPSCLPALRQVWQP